MTAYFWPIDQQQTAPWDESKAKKSESLVINSFNLKYMCTVEKNVPLLGILMNVTFAPV